VASWRGCCCGLVCHHAATTPPPPLLLSRLSSRVAVCVRASPSRDHASFAPCGPFPPHCVQGSVGSQFFPSVGAALSDAIRLGHRVKVVFKGFAENVDSFGNFQYDQKWAESRLSHRGSCSVEMTGGFVLKMSNFAADINAPPDVMAVMHRQTLADVIVHERMEVMESVRSVSRFSDAGSLARAFSMPTIAVAVEPPRISRSASAELDSVPAKASPPAALPAPHRRRLFVCGLAFDFCVIDSAVAAARSGLFDDVFVVYDASRAAYVPGVGTYGSGFLTNPADMVGLFYKHNVKLVGSATLRRCCPPPAGAGVASGSGGL
jgi:nicotinamidase-related amidase